MFLSHNTIMMDPGVAKDLLRILKDNVENYEKKFGQIKVKKIKKVKPEVEESDDVDYASYIG